VDKESLAMQHGGTNNVPSTEKQSVFGRKAVLIVPTDSAPEFARRDRTASTGTKLRRLMK
jgi:hypothetical protein